MSSWLVLYFAENAEWKEKALKEIRSFVAQYASKEEGQSLAQQLSQIPSQVWEDEMPVLDQCLRETIRRSMTGATLRRVMQDGDEDPNLVIEGKKLKKGQFLAYHITGTHHNPEIYTDPYKCVTTTSSFVIDVLTDQHFLDGIPLALIAVRTRRSTGRSWAGVLVRLFGVGSHRLVYCTLTL